MNNSISVIFIAHAIIILIRTSLFWVVFNFFASIIPNWLFCFILTDVIMLINRRDMFAVCA